MSDLSPDLAEHRDWLLSLLLPLQPGTFLDLGCGAGEFCAALAGRQTHPDSRFVGLDAAESKILTARSATNDPRVEFRHEKVGARLPFSAATVDVVYSHNLLECLADPPSFVHEVARILKPGGQVLMAHWDWDSQVFDGTDKAAVRRLMHAFADWQQPWMDSADGWMGRRLWGLFDASSLFDGRPHARVMINTIFAPPWYGHARAHDLRHLVTHGLARAADYEQLLRDQDTLAQEGRYFYSITGYAYVGCRRAV